jgi:hypothetical protein
MVILDMPKTQNIAVASPSWRVKKNVAGIVAAYGIILYDSSRIESEGRHDG